MLGKITGADQNWNIFPTPQRFLFCMNSILISTLEPFVVHFTTVTEKCLLMLMFKIYCLLFFYIPRICVHWIYTDAATRIFTMYCMSLHDLYLWHRFPSDPDLCPYYKDDRLHPLVETKEYRIEGRYNWRGRLTIWVYMLCRRYYVCIRNIQNMR